MSDSEKNLNNTMACGRSIADPIGWLNFVALCAIQGSTFVAMRIAVAPGGSFSPLWMAASRFTAGGALMLTILGCLGIKLQLSFRHLAASLFSGVLLCGGGTGFAALASKMAGPALVALFFSLAPICAAAMDWAITGRRPSAVAAASMLTCATGVALLVLRPDGASPNVAMFVALLLGPIAYAAGGVLLKHTVLTDAAGPRASMWVIITWQLVGGALSLWAAVLVVGEPRPRPTLAGWAAWGYLTLISTLIAFSAYLIALQRLHTPIFMSHSWIFPMTAAVLGWAVLGDSLPMKAIPSAVLILGGLVTLVITARGKGKSPAPSRESANPACPSPKAFGTPQMCETH